MTLLLFLLVSAGAAPLGDTAADSGLVVNEVTGDPGVVEGTVTVGAPSSVVASALSDVARWSAIFSDVKDARRTGRKDSGREVVEVESRLLGHRHEFRLERSQRSVSLELLDGHGFGMSTAFAVHPVDERTSRVTARVALRATGLLGWFRSKRSLLTTARDKVRTDLGDLSRAFRRP